MTEGSSASSTTGEVGERPWGRYLVLLDDGLHKVKEVTVEPGRRLSYQRHRLRCEHWFVVTGEALVTLDGVDQHVRAGESVDVPVLSSHRIANVGVTPLVFVEVQTGDYFGEDDIERFDDDFGRS